MRPGVHSILMISSKSNCLSSTAAPCRPNVISDTLLHLIPMRDLFYDSPPQTYVHQHTRTRMHIYTQSIFVPIQIFYDPSFSLFCERWEWAECWEANGMQLVHCLCDVDCGHLLRWHMPRRRIDAFSARITQDNVAPVEYCFMILHGFYCSS